MVGIRVPIMNLINLKMLNFYHHLFYLIGDLENVQTWDATSFIVETIAFEKPLFSKGCDFDVINISKHWK
jgi:hypothetical protein